MTYAWNNKQPQVILIITTSIVTSLVTGIGSVPEKTRWEDVFSTKQTNHCYPTGNQIVSDSNREVLSVCEALWFGNDVLKKKQNPAADVPLMERQERKEEMLVQFLVLVWPGIWVF